MAEQPVTNMQQRVMAGREYLASLKRLGFTPDALFWAMVGGAKVSGSMELLIVTTWTDSVGPKAIYDLLFEAYDASATPKEIDPFTVTLLSHSTQISIDLEAAIHTIERETRTNPEIKPMIVLGMMDYYTAPPWILWHRRSGTTAFDDARRFAAFQRNIAQLAA